jgi:hypothetical protein
VADVDEQLEHYGYKPAPATEAASDAGGAPKGRTTPAEAKQTTAEGGPSKPQAAQKPAAAPKPPAQKPAGGKA